MNALNTTTTENADTIEGFTPDSYFDNDNEATYCPEDDKIRLYVGRVPREEYLALRDAGYTSTPKQDCDFVATWTVRRENIALDYAGMIGDEDQSPTDRAADRAERFAEYRNKRTAEATGHADRYDEGPKYHGYQSEAVAERRAKRHDMQATRAVTQWGKAEYWQSRTAGVISHALYVSSPGVRMGRIKKIEKEIRSAEKGHADYAKRFNAWSKLLTMPDDEKTHAIASQISGSSYGLQDYKHPRSGKENGLWSLLESDRNDGDPITGHEAATLWLENATDPDDETTGSKRYKRHLQLRLAYENQMLEAQGGRAAHVEMVAGGWIGKRQIQKVNKSNATGRVTSVNVLIPYDTMYCDPAKVGKGLMVSKVLKTERLSKEVYRAPTPEELEAFNTAKAEAKKANKKPKAPPTVNLTDADAEKLQAILNTRITSHWPEQKEVLRMTQKQYSASSKGAYARVEIINLAGGGYARSQYDTVMRVRIAGGHYNAQVIVLTDKPQKAAPEALWIDSKENDRKEVKKQRKILGKALGCSSVSTMDEKQTAVFNLARKCGIVNLRSTSQFEFTDSGRDYVYPENVKKIKAVIQDLNRDDFLMDPANVEIIRLAERHDFLKATWNSAGYTLTSKGLKAWTASRKA